MSGFIEAKRLGSDRPIRNAIVVLNFGGPTKPEEVQPFLFELFNDPDVIKLPFGPGFQRRVAERVSSSRAGNVIPQYQAIGGSPIVATTMAQVAAIKAALGPEAPPIHVGMRYSEPSIAKMVAGIRADPPDRIVALSLYPHYSDTTTGSSFNAFAQQMNAAGLSRLPVRYIPAFYDQPRYLAALIDRIRGALAKSGGQPHLLFSAHGLPSSYVRSGDPYQAQIQDTVRLVVREMGWSGPYSLAYQSKVGPVRWLKPSTEEEIHALAERGVKELVLVPVSFVSDHIETLYEIDVTFGDFAKAHGVKMIRTEALDTHPELIGCLADLLRAGLADDSYQGLGEHRCVRCLHPKPQLHRMRTECLDCGHHTPLYLLHLPPVKE